MAVYSLYVGLAGSPQHGQQEQHFCIPFCCIGQFAALAAVVEIARQAKVKATSFLIFMMLSCNS
jgi:hypothetical protein